MQKNRPNHMMNWLNCFSGERYGDSNTQTVERTEYERDWDRLIFSSAFRRLQSKTQVFPLPDEVFVHNRLTHSLEVASVGRSLGKMVGHKIALFPEVAANPGAISFYNEHLKSVIASACLAHDLGNPAFGHSGESAISRYFIEKGRKDPEFVALFSDREWSDLTAFEGNANALRILTRAFKGRLEGGFRLTYSTLGAILKYPCGSGDSLGKHGPAHRKKYGFFQAERSVFESVTAKLRMVPDADTPHVFRRHPFVYLVEAADDICYNIVDFEDAHRIGIFSSEFVIDTLTKLVILNPADDPERIAQTVDALRVDANEAISYLRAKAINYLANRCASIFVENADSIISGTFEGDLIGRIAEARPQLREINSLSVDHIYNHESVIKIELSGYTIMAGLIKDFVEAALLPETERSSYEKKILALIPAQYMYEATGTPYEKVMCILDFISGMTDVYALKLYRNLTGIEIPRI